MKEQIKSFNYVYWVVLSGNLLALTGDISHSWSSPVLPKLASNDTNINPLGRSITSEESSWIASINTIGSMIGVVPFGFLPNLIGRKRTILFIAIPHFVAYVMMAFAKSIYLYYIGRFLNGFSLVACYMVLPMYVAEISPVKNRGLMLVSYGIFAKFGSLLPYITGPFISIMWFNLLLAAFPLVFFISFFFIAPESPYYYVQKKKFGKAREVLQKLSSRETKDVETEIESIENTISSADKGGALKTLKTRYAMKGVAIVMVLVVFQQLSGFSAFMRYTQSTFKDAGSSLSPVLSSIVVGLVFFATSFICPFVVDRWGRKILLITSLTGIIISEIAFGIYCFVKDRGIDVSSVSWISLLSLITYMVMFGVGLSPMPSTVASEVLPPNIKFRVVMLAGLGGAVGGFLESKFYNDLNVHITMAGTFWLFAGMTLLLLLFVIFFLPETKGKSFSEIREILNR